MRFVARYRYALVACGVAGAGGYALGVALGTVTGGAWYGTVAAFAFVFPCAIVLGHLGARIDIRREHDAD